MTMDIATILGIDGIATGAIYALVAIGTVLIFTVTRVIFIPFGDIAAFTALTLAALRQRGSRERSDLSSSSRAWRA